LRETPESGDPQKRAAFEKSWRDSREVSPSIF